MESEVVPQQEQEVDLIARQIYESNYISRDLSWLQFNYRVLDQARHIDRSIFDRLKFLSITASNLDEFCTIRLGSLYNYLDYGKPRFDYSGLREEPFRGHLLSQILEFAHEQHDYFIKKLKPHFQRSGFYIGEYHLLSPVDTETVNQYFQKIIYPMLTPMLFDNYHTFPTLKNNRLLFGVVTKAPQEPQNHQKVSFIQIPSNLSSFYEIKGDDGLISFVPIEEIIRNNIQNLSRKEEFISNNLFPITLSANLASNESKTGDSNCLERPKRKSPTRRTGRGARREVADEPEPWMRRMLKTQWGLDDLNIIH